MSCEHGAHNWIPNSGRGGDTVFKQNRQMSSEPVMHVQCGKCGDRTFFTAAQWEKMNAWDDVDTYGPSA